MSKLIVRIAILVLVVVPLRGQDPDVKTLQGIRGLWVVVQNLGSEVEAAGLHGSDIQTDVELKLRLAGIKVNSKADSVNEAGFPYLWVIARVKLEGSIAAFSLSVELCQNVVLTRDPAITLAATTFRVTNLGTVGKDNLRGIRDVIKDGVDQFLNAYLSVNPKK